MRFSQVDDRYERRISRRVQNGIGIFWNIQQGNEMTPAELYEVLDRAGADYEIVEIFDGVRIISVVVDDEQTNTVLECSPTTGEKS